MSSQHPLSHIKQVHLQNKKQERLNEQLRLRDEERRELDELEEEHQRKKHEVRRRYKELLDAIERKDQPALPLLLPAPVPSQAISSPQQLHAAKHGAPAATPAAAAAANQDHQVLLSNGSLTDAAPGAKSAADGSPNASEERDQATSDDMASPSIHQDETRASVDASGGDTDEEDAELPLDSIVPDSEDEAARSGASDQLHARRYDSQQAAQPQSRLAAASHRDTAEDEPQASGQAGSREGAEAEVATSSGGQQSGPLKGRLGDTFYVFREPRSLPEASEILSLLQQWLFPIRMLQYWPALLQQETWLHEYLFCAAANWTRHGLILH